MGNGRGLMKIGSDLNQYQTGRGAVAHGSVPEASPALNNDITRRGATSRPRLDQERAMNEAMAIAHMSHVLVQKAMEISGRLRSIAMRAMSTGSIDTAELGDAVSSINASFSAFGEHIPSPAGTVGKSMDSLKSIASSMNEGTIPDMKDFDNLDRRLAAAGNDLIPRGFRELNHDSADAVIKATSGYITADPKKGISAQYALKPETVMKLVG